MQIPLNTNGEKQAYNVSLRVQKPCRIRVMAVNPDKPKTIYMDRFKMVKDVYDFELRLPQCGKKVLLIATTDYGDSNAVRIQKCEKIKLKECLSCIPNGKAREFIKFAQQFSENCSILSTSFDKHNASVYMSDEGNFRIDFLPFIVAKGRKSHTPARISNQNGRIEVSKEHFINYTVPMRMAVLLHEFSHFNLNEDMHDEVEADLNGIKMYMGLGYPVIEGHKSFISVFKGLPTKQNVERYEFLKTFMDNFDELKSKYC